MYIFQQINIFYGKSKPLKEKVTIDAISLDNKDFEILKLLQQNARITVKEVADAIHLSTTPVHDRIKRLEQSGIIMQYAAMLNAAKLGKTYGNLPCIIKRA